MHIKRILSQHRRDFTAVYVCEHCQAEETSSGYDDRYFHDCVIPEMKCKSCGLTATDYTPMSTKYPEGLVV